MGELRQRFRLPRGVDLLPKPVGPRLPLLITGSSRQSPQWLAEHGDGWMTYPRAVRLQQRFVAEVRARAADAGQPDRPVMQPLYVDLDPDPGAAPRPIHLGWRAGVQFLADHLRALQRAGINHVALNLRFQQGSVERTLDQLAETVLPDFRARKEQRMPKTILITGATDGIGRATARRLLADGHDVLLHGRNADKLARVRAELGGEAPPEGFLADLADLDQVRALADAVATARPRLDVLINNAGVFKTAHPRTADGEDVRFVVNTLAPALLTRRLLPCLAPDGRVVNLSSAAQAPVDLEALAGRRPLDDFAAYAQSKLALTAWSAALAAELGPDGPTVVAVNPGSLLDTNMVRQGFGRSRAGVGVGVDVLVQAALSEAFAGASGRYFDNDAGRFADPHPDAVDPVRRAAIAEAVDARIGAGR